MITTGLALLFSFKILRLKKGWYLLNEHKFKKMIYRIYNGKRKDELENIQKNVEFLDEPVMVDYTRIS